MLSFSSSVESSEPTLGVLFSMAVRRLIQNGRNDIFKDQKMVCARSKLLTLVIHASVIGLILWFFVLFSYKDSHAIRYRNQKVEERSLLKEERKRTKMVAGTENRQEPVVRYSSITKDKFPITNNALKNYFLHINESNTASSYKSTILAFVHNQKSGGTTLKQCLSTISQYQNKEPILVTNDNRAAIEENILNGAWSITHNDIYVGAATFGVCENLAPKTCAYFTILREPYERMISHYMFCRNGGKTGLPCHNRTIEEFAISIGSIFFTHITAHMSCTKSCDSCREDSETGTNGLWRCERLYSSFYDVRRQSVLDYVIKNLDRLFAVIGLTEEYDTSLAMFQETFGLPLSDVCTGVHANNGIYSNVQVPYEDTAGQQRRRYIDVMKRKLKANENVSNSIDADLQIYERALEIFNRQKEIYLQTR